MGTSNSVRRAQPLLGTFVEITGPGALRVETECAIEAAFQAISEVHRLMSFHDPDSDVSRLNREAFVQAVTVHAWTYQVLNSALEWYRASSGAFDITIAPVLQNLGLLPPPADHTQFDAARTNAPDAIELLSDHRVRFRHPGVRIDLGGIAKGFAVDRALEVMRPHNLSHGLVNAGGDLAAFGPHAETINIRDPREPSRLLCQLEIADAAIASSGSLFDPLHSADPAGATIIDPSTQAPVHAVVGATVCAPTCMIADALTKIVMIAGDRSTALLRQHQAHALLVLASGEVRVTPDWQDAVRVAA